MIGFIIIGIKLSSFSRVSISRAGAKFMHYYHMLLTKSLPPGDFVLCSPDTFIKNYVDSTSLLTFLFKRRYCLVLTYPIYSGNVSHTRTLTGMPGNYTEVWEYQFIPLLQIRLSPNLPLYWRISLSLLDLPPQDRLDLSLNGFIFYFIFYIYFWFSQIYLIHYT